MRDDAERALREGDLGDEVAPGAFIKDLGKKTITPDRSKGEVEESAPVSNLQRKTLREREKLVGQVAAQVMDYYMENLNNNEILNPIRDGIPQCTAHPFPPGCTQQCKTGVLERVRDYSLGDVFQWVQDLARRNYYTLLRRRPELRGYRSGSM